MSTPFEPLTAHEKARVVQVLCSEDDFPSYVGSHATTITEKVFAAFLQARFGAAPGSTAYHPRTDKAATRYFDPEFSQLRWIIFDSPRQSKLTAERVDDLPVATGWQVRERPWSELVFK